MSNPERQRAHRKSRAPRKAFAAVAAAVLVLAGAVWTISAAAATGPTIFVSPSGNDANPGTETLPIKTLARARDLVRTMNANLTADLTVQLADGTYRLAAPLVLNALDSGSGGHRVIWTAAPGAHPVVSGGVRVTGWSVADAGRNLWSAPAPASLTNTRQLYIDQHRAARAAGSNVGTPQYVENAFELLDQPGEWYLDRTARRIFYIPRPGEDLGTAEVEAPVLETLLSGSGTTSSPLHDVTFAGIQFSYATWLLPSTGEGFSEIQANYTLTGAGAYATQGLCQLVAGGTCPFGAWSKIHNNVWFTNARGVQLLDDVFAHLGGSGPSFGNGVQDSVVKGCVFTDISGNGLRIGDVTIVSPTTGQATTGNTVTDNYFTALPVE